MKLFNAVSKAAETAKNMPLSMGQGAPSRPSGRRIFMRDMLLCAIIGPTFEFLYGFLFYQFTGSLFVEYYFFSVYGHTSLLSAAFWGPTGAVLLQCYRETFCIKKGYNYFLITFIIRIFLATFFVRKEKYRYNIFP